MVVVHATIGTIVVLAFALDVIMGLFQLVSRPIPSARYVAWVAAVALVVQLGLGFTLLMRGHENVSLHYVLALAAIIPVGVEHGYAQSRRTPRARIGTAAVAATVALLLVVLAYLVGQGTIG
jgi:hypothetical protein